MAEAARGEVMPERQWFTLTSFARAMPSEYYGTAAQ
jgi:hypothetical protein